MNFEKPMLVLLKRLNGADPPGIAMMTLLRNISTEKDKMLTAFRRLACARCPAPELNHILIYVKRHIQYIVDLAKPASLPEPLLYCKKYQTAIHREKAGEKRNAVLYFQRISSDFGFLLCLRQTHEHAIKIQPLSTIQRPVAN